MYATGVLGPERREGEYPLPSQDFLCAFAHNRKKCMRFCAFSDITPEHGRALCSVAHIRRASPALPVDAWVGCSTRMSIQAPAATLEPKDAWHISFYSRIRTSPATDLGAGKPASNPFGSLKEGKSLSKRECRSDRMPAGLRNEDRFRWSGILEEAMIPQGKYTLRGDGQVTA